MNLRAAIFLSIALAAGLAGADELPVEVEVSTIKAAETLLGRIEKELRAQPGVEAAVVANVTLPLQTAIEEELGRGKVKLYPRATFDVLQYLMAEGRIAYARGGWTLPGVLSASDLPLSDAAAVPARIANLPA